jgi:hydrogenase maturation factor
VGKLNKKELEWLLKCIKEDARVLVPPLPGYDSGVHFLGDKCMVVSTDPCSDVPENWFGWLLINYAASDVALFGAKPEFCTINLLGPPKTESIIFEKIMNQVCDAANELNMVVVTGHTGTYESVNKMVGVCTAYGTVEKDNLIMPSNIKSGDLILQIKEISLEILTNFSLLKNMLSKKLFGIDKTRRLSQLVGMQSCVNEALNLASLGGVNAMHDSTEGGLVTNLNELANSSDLGFEVEIEKVLIRPEIRILQDYFDLSEVEVLSMSSTGSLFVAIDPKEKDRIIKEISRLGYLGSFIGEFTKNKNRVIIRNKKKLSFPVDAVDPYNKILFG